jgi:hypothetical protein
MKIYWWMGGLHFKPDTEQEGKAMELLFNAAKKTTLNEVAPTTSFSGMVKVETLRPVDVKDDEPEGVEVNATL